jgi:hypothetical protein
MLGAAVWHQQNGSRHGTELFRVYSFLDQIHDLYFFGLDEPSAIPEAPEFQIKITPLDSTPLFGV